MLVFLQVKTSNYWIQYIFADKTKTFDLRGHILEHVADKDLKTFNAKKGCKTKLFSHVISKKH